MTRETVSQEFVCAGVGHVEAGAGPLHFVETAIVVMDEVFLVVGEGGTFGVPAEGDEPEAGGHAEGVERVGGGFHAGRVGAGGLMGGVVAVGELPLVVDLDEVEAVGGEGVVGEGGEFLEGFFVGGAAVGAGVPGAVAAGDGFELDVVVPGDEVGVGFEALQGVGEVADDEGFAVGGGVGGEAKVAVVGAGGDREVVVRGVGEDDAAGAVVGEPGGDDAGAGGGVGGGEEGVTRAGLIGGGEAVAAEDAEVGEGDALAAQRLGGDGEVEGGEGVNELFFVGRVVGRVLEEDEGGVGEEGDAIDCTIGASEDDGFAVGERGGVIGQRGGGGGVGDGGVL